MTSGVVWVNGAKLEVPCDVANQPLATFIKAQGNLKSVRVACGEGGCGACAVALVEELDGRPYLRTINSCLAPVYSVLGRSVITAEGLPALPDSGGVSLVADRLASFHASQCGYCTPGFTVACHTAMHNAAASSSSTGSDGATSGSGNCDAPEHIATAAGGISGVVDDSQLRRALDGNLCRCTGYRPIVAACRAIAAEICDLEDLCGGRGAGYAAALARLSCADAGGSSQQPGPGTVAPGAASTCQASPGNGATVEEVPLGGGQVLRTPRSLAQLVAESGRLAQHTAARKTPSTTSAAAAAAGDTVAYTGPPEGANGPASRSGHGGGSWRLVAGSTGHGVFKDWPTEEAVLLSLAEVPELKRLEISTDAALEGATPGSGNSNGRAPFEQPHLHIGSCVTLQRLAARMEVMAGGARAADGKGVGGGDGDGGGVRQWAAETAAHLYRIAGAHVRNVATVGGNLALAAERGLPSDVATLLGAAGASVELLLVSADPATHGTVVHLDLMAFMAGQRPAALLPDCPSYILTAVRVPIPSDKPRVTFWSQRIADRHSNAAAVVNAAVMVRLSPGPQQQQQQLVVGELGSSSEPPNQQGPDGSNCTHDGAIELPLVEEVRIVVGYRTPARGRRSSARNGSAGGEDFGAPQGGGEQGRDDPSAVLLGGWRCIRAAAAEAALRGRPATVGSVVAALEALVAEDLAGDGRERSDAKSSDGGGEGEAGAETVEGTVAAPVLMAEGLVAQGLLACAGLASETVRIPTTAAATTSSGSTNGQHTNSSLMNGSDYSGRLPDKCPSGSELGSEVNTHGTCPGGVEDVAPRPAATTCLPARLPAPPLVVGQQFLPPAVPSLAPVTEPIPKLGSKLQASGAAHYTEDVPVHANALYGAFVLSARAGATLAAVDPSAALALPGVVRFVCATDLPAVGARNFTDPNLQPGPREPLLVEVGGRCEFAGQALGLVLADSPWQAERAAKAVQVTYGKINDDGNDDTPPPILTIAEAVQAGSFYQLSKQFPFFPPGTSYGGAGYMVKGTGDIDAALRSAGVSPAVDMTSSALGLAAMTAVPNGAAGPTAGPTGTDREANGSRRPAEGPAAGAPAPPAAAATPAAAVPAAQAGLRVVSGRYFVPSQLHFYMETQSAVAWPDEEGSVMVHSSCQSTSTIQTGVATVLGLPHTKVQVRCRRVGGGFGGKIGPARRVAAMAAVAAVATGRQVRIKVPRATDAAMGGGRCDADVSYVAIVDRDGDSAGATAAAAGTCPGSGTRIRALDIHVVLQGGAYLDAAHVDVMGLLAAVDSVYDIAAFRAEAALARCNLPPRTTVRGPGEIQAAMIIEHVMEHVAAELGVDPEVLRQDNFIQLPPPPPPPTPPPAQPVPVDGPQGDRSGPGATAQAPPQPARSNDVKLSSGKCIPARLFNLAHLWEELRAKAGWEQLKADVEAFNAATAWCKRGLAMMPTRYPMFRGRKPAYVSVLPDGTVQVATHGIEMGQGLHTKVAQVAALTLGEVLPAPKRPLDLRLIKVADNSTELLPNGGVTGGSTSSEMACAAVRLACLQIVEGLRVHAVPKMKGRENFEWEELIASVSARGFVTAPLSALAWGGQADLPESSSPDAPGPVDPVYHVLGVALAVVEVDVLTGERRVLRSDILFDLGRPANPAVDLGQVEGAFVQGLGMMLQEQATYDTSTGALLQTSTWNYKPPAASCVPGMLNVHILNDVPLASGGPVSSKACGEPPLLLSYVVLAALQRAVNAARRAAGEALLAAPATAAGSGSDGAAGAPASAAQDCTAGRTGLQSGPNKRPDLGGSAADIRPLLAPATAQRVRLACGGWTAAQLLQAQAAMR